MPTLWLPVLYLLVGPAGMLTSIQRPAQPLVWWWCAWMPHCSLPTPTTLRVTLRPTLRMDRQQHTALDVSTLIRATYWSVLPLAEAVHIPARTHATEPAVQALQSCHGVAEEACVNRDTCVQPPSACGPGRSCARACIHTCISRPQGAGCDVMTTLCSPCPLQLTACGSWWLT